MAARIVAVALVAMFGCGDTDPASTDGTDARSTDDVDGSDAAIDTTDVPDARPDAPDREARPAGAPCEDDIECEALACLQVAPDVPGVCSQRCFESSDCPNEDEWACLFVVTSGSDGERLCVPIGLCFDDDGDGYGVGPGCDGADCDDTVATTHVGADETCNGADDDCDGVVDDNPIDGGASCTTDFAGVCAEGRTACVDGLLDCVGRTAASLEICDGLDNDCDGAIDEDDDGDPLAERCYAAPERTDGVGVCTAGERRCVDGALTECVGMVTPGFAELCNGVDDDCDGEVDEDVPGAGALCNADLPGVCATGVTACVDGDVVCFADVAPGAEPERCDGLDNDCNGIVDDDPAFEGLGDPCVAGVGSCAAVGRIACDADDPSAPAQCTAVPLAPTDEVCNGFDDDCDGMIDDLDDAALCPLQRGVCAGARQICAGAGGFLPCSTINYGPDYEPFEVSCDGLDNDCDGEVDNVDVDGDGVIDEACGGADCNDLNPLVYTGYREICGDGLDNDCDGTAENLDADEDGVVARACGGPDCNDGSDRVRPGLSEVCGDRLDNDCDGSIDNRDDDGDSFLAVACGGTDCDDDDNTAFPGNPEVCDGVDNDCNTVVDDRDVDGDGFRPLACGGEDCDDDDIAVHPDALEVCGDEVDDDCSGVLDDRDADGDGRLALACGGDDCGDDSDAIYPGAPEIYDTRDSDCDGLVDEGLFAPGALIVSEFMKNPTHVSDTAGEWFEVHNTTDRTINLNSWTIRDLDGTDAWVIREPGPVYVPARGYAVLCRNPDPLVNGGVDCDAGYDDFVLANTDDEIELSLDGRVIDTVAYGESGWPTTPGLAGSLDSGSLDGALNDIGGNWCSASTPYNDDDSGTPGEPNPVCR